MAKRTHYRIITEFTYSNDQPGGILDTIVNSKKAIDAQIEANNTWLSYKGHRATKTTITPMPPTE